MAISNLFIMGQTTMIMGIVFLIIAAIHYFSPIFQMEESRHLNPLNKQNTFKTLLSSLIIQHNFY